MNNSQSDYDNDNSSAQEMGFQLSPLDTGLLFLDIILSMKAFVLNGAALFVFIKSKTTISNSGIRLLIITEMGLCLSRGIAGFLFYYQVEAWIYFFTLGNAWLCSRNWWVTVITMCRCIAIFKPLRANHILTFRRQVIAYALVLIPSFVISGVRHPCVSSIEVPNYCNYSVVVFIYQSGIPVPTVAVTSVIMVLYLVASPETNITRQLYYVRRATRTVLALAITFAILESPALILTSLNTAGVTYPLYLDTISNLCISLDSASNFVIFLAITRNFKRGLHGLVFRQNSTVQDPYQRYRGRSMSNNSPSGSGALLRIQGCATNSTSVRRGHSLRNSMDRDMTLIQRDSHVEARLAGRFPPS